MANRLVIVVVLCILGAACGHPGINSEEEIKKFMENGEACRGEVGAAASDIDDIIKKKPAAGMEGKCLRSCLMKKYGVMDNNGKFVKSVAMEHAEKLLSGDAEKMKIATEIVDECSAITVPGDHCEAGETYAKCIHEKAKAHKMDHFEV